MLLRFTKMHGLGNDFALLDLITQNVQISEEDIKRLADRNTGIGFDQLLIAEPPRNPEADFYYRSFNADGSEAEQCGNGARCFLRFVRDRGLTTKLSIKVETKSGCIECRLEADGNITVNLGKPRLCPSDIPFQADNPQITYRLKLDSPEPNNSPELTNSPATCAQDLEVEISAVSMGNPHAVLLVEDVENAPVKQLGAAIEAHKHFPNKANVGFMQVMDRQHIKLRVFERGVGETRACGSGACAAVVAGRLQGLLDDVVRVEFGGGSVTVSWRGNESPVFLTGSVCRVYEGRLQI